MFKYVSFKSFFDFSFSFLILILISPFILFVLIILLVDLNERPLFIQKRPGFKGKVFSLYKFKTMKTVFDNKGNLLSDNIRLTLIGKILRTLSIDELPQLFNILKGEMSFIGPRPCEVSIFEGMPNWAKKRFLVKPGISGLAQIIGGYNITWEQRWIHDIEYIKNISLSHDLIIFFKTFISILNG